MRQLPTDRYIVEIALTHDHFEGQRTPDYFQVLAVPLAVDAHAMIAGPYDKVVVVVGEPLWDKAVPVSPPVAAILMGDEDGGTFDRFLQVTGLGLAHSWPERFEWSIEGPDDCGICGALVETSLRSQGRLV